jgi:hypothetical protein
MDSNFEYITNLQYKVKILTFRLQEFESEEKYKKMKSEHNLRISEKNLEIRRLKAELAGSYSHFVTMNNNWSLVFEDVEKEHKRELKKKDRKIKELEQKLLTTLIQLDENKAKVTAKNTELYQVKTELEEEQGKNRKLIAQINRDYINSSIPSSMKPNHKKISNSREKTGKKPGGQIGHIGHRRKKLETTNSIYIPAPSKYMDRSAYKPTGKIITKQLVDLRVIVSTHEYYTPEFRDIKTGQRVHAQFPEGVQNDINYGSGIKSFAFLLNNHCCVSIDKTCEFLSGLTEGKLNISKGMVNGLSKEFSRKTKSEQMQAFSDLLLSPVLNSDCTNARVNGKSVYLYVCATPKKAMYFARENKGHKGIKNTPIEDYQGIIVHDHDRTFYKYGSGHQECLAHVLRYLKDSIENEPGLQWNKQMRGLLQEMIHTRNSLDSNASLDAKDIAEFEDRYCGILAVAKNEYEYEPPSKYYKDGYNLYRRLDEYMVNHLLFLRDSSIPSDNNLSERLLRIFKRKQKQVMSFRSFDNLGYLCNGMTMIALMRAKNENLYTNISKIFN